MERTMSGFKIDDIKVGFDLIDGREYNVTIEEDDVVKANALILGTLGGETKFAPVVDSVLLSECWCRVIANKVMSDEIFSKHNYVVLNLNFVLDEVRFSVRKDDMKLGGAMHAVL
jgi:F420-0:gamma-glutamyl ligase-like protein